MPVHPGRAALTVTVAVALTLALTPAAGAQVATRGPASRKSAPMLNVHTPAQFQLPPGLPAGVRLLPPSYIPISVFPAGSVTAGTTFWEICLWNASSHCLGDTDDPGDVDAASGRASVSGVPPRTGDVSPDTGSAVVLLEVAGSTALGNIVSTTLWFYRKQVAHGVVKSYKWIKSFWYSGTHAGYASNDGQALGDWSYNADATLGNSNSLHGIYWQNPSSPSGGSRWWNTYTHADLIAPNLNDDSPVFDHAPEDWSSWGITPIVVEGA